ncbi:MAG: hypothetical protein CMJ49_01200 [Planctomycetaceae bacterium]|nr:hypothetical protein [Planctomycetaceae bacterium]
MAILMTDQQKDELNDRGFIILENVLAADEVDTISQAIDEVVARVREARDLPDNVALGIRNGLVYHDEILNLLDRPDILSMVVDVMGWNIHNRDSIVIVTMPQGPDDDPDQMPLGWHFDYEEEFAGSTVDGTMPIIDFKVGWYISDHSEPGHSTTLVVPGSYKWTPRQRATWEQWIDPDDIVSIDVPAGSAMLWRPTLLHGVTPNLTQNIRKTVQVSYTPRWIRPSGHIEQDPDLIARSSPVRRQLLGAMGNLMNPLGKDVANNPNSQYWFTDDWDNVPLKAWAEQRAAPGPPDWGTGHGVSHTKGPGFKFTQRTVPRK